MNIDSKYPIYIKQTMNSTTNEITDNKIPVPDDGIYIAINSTNIACQPPLTSCISTLENIINIPGFDINERTIMMYNTKCTILDYYILHSCYYEQTEEFIDCIKFLIDNGAIIPSNNRILNNPNLSKKLLHSGHLIMTPGLFHRYLPSCNLNKQNKHQFDEYTIEY